MEEPRRKRPLLWGGCFLFLVLMVYFAAGEFRLPKPVEVRLLQALSPAQIPSPHLIYEYRLGAEDVLLLHWDQGEFSPLEGWEATGQALAFNAKGQELWRRELPGPVRVKALSASWMAADLLAGEVFSYRADGKLAWRQQWTWPLQDFFLSPTGEVAVTLGPLWEEGLNHLEKLVLVNGEGQAVWEHPCRNASILTAAFDEKGEYLALTGLTFSGPDMVNWALLLDREGEIRGDFTSPREEFFHTTALGEESWFLAGEKTLYSLPYSGGRSYRHSFAGDLQRLLPAKGRDGLLALSWVEGGKEAGSILSYLNSAGELVWQESFCTPADQLELGVSQRGVLVGDNQGIYGLSYAGEVDWHYSSPQLSRLFVDPWGKYLLVAGEDGVWSLLELPE